MPLLLLPLVVVAVVVALRIEALIATAKKNEFEKFKYLFASNAIYLQYMLLQYVAR